VLGHGAHPDPGPELADAITAARATAASDGRELPVVVALVGTSGDPQGFSATAEVLAAAGAEVFLSAAEATRRAIQLLEGGHR
jgi:methylmalonyl-CoA mutase cobalamin-binding subunit